MFRIGLTSFLLSTLGVFFGVAELGTVAYPWLKTVCLTGLSASLICFAGTYIQAERARWQKTLPHDLDMVESPDWKMSSIR
jgi:hypothetical protein